MPLTRWRRKTDKLITVDRALLVLAISAGMWAGAAATKSDNQAATIANVTEQFKSHELQHGTQQLETVEQLATLKTQVRAIEQDTSRMDTNLAKLATSMATVVNRLPDRQ